MANAPSFSFFTIVELCGDFSRGLCVRVCGWMWSVFAQRQQRRKNEKTTSTINTQFCSLPAFLHFIIMFLDVCCFCCCCCCCCFFCLALVATAFLCLSLLLTFDRPLPAIQSNFQLGWLFSHLKY